MTAHAARIHHARVNDEDEGTGKGWLLAWLIAGLLAAHEVGALAMRADGDWGAVLSLAFLVVSIAGLGFLAAGAIRRAQPARLRAPALISFVALLGCLWALYGGSIHSGWTTTVMFGVLYSAACLLAGGTAMAVAWRRRRAHDARLAEARSDRDRHRRLEGIRTESSMLAAAAVSPEESDPLGPDSDFTLPARPRWEDS